MGRYLDLADSIGRRGNDGNEINERYEISPTRQLQSVSRPHVEQRADIQRDTSDVEVDAPSGWTLADWQPYAERNHGPGCAVTPIAGLPKPRAPANLDDALRTACDGVAGITPAQFRSLLSPEDIEAGAIHPKTLHAYAVSSAEGIRSGRLVPLAKAKP